MTHASSGTPVVLVILDVEGTGGRAPDGAGHGLQSTQKLDGIATGIPALTPAPAIDAVACSTVPLVAVVGQGHGDLATAGRGDQSLEDAVLNRPGRTQEGGKDGDAEADEALLVGRTHLHFDGEAGLPADHDLGVVGGGSWDAHPG